MVDRPSQAGTAMQFGCGAGPLLLERSNHLLAARSVAIGVAVNGPLIAIVHQGIQRGRRATDQERRA